MHTFSLTCRCHKLVYACFSYCEHIFDAGIELMGQMKSLVYLDLRGCNIGDEVSIIFNVRKLFVYCSLLIMLKYQDLCTYVRTYVRMYVQNTYVRMYVFTLMYGHSINQKSANRSSFLMYLGTFMMYPSLCKWH